MADLPELLTFTDHGPFARDTLRVRMPTILTKAIDYLYRHLHETEELQADDTLTAVSSRPA